VTRETQWQEEWKGLRAERDLARRRWRSAADELAVRARDPLGLGRLVRDHPVASTGIGAAAGALLARLFLGGARPSRDAASKNGDGDRAAPVWSTLLREAALSVALPWLLRMLKEKLGWDLGGLAAPPEENTSVAGPAPEPARP
jgi:hypothetical protein